MYVKILLAEIQTNVEKYFNISKISGKIFQKIY